MKKLIVILCAVVAVFGLTSCKSSSPSDTVKAYYKALQAGDYEKALSYTDITDQETIQKQIAKYKEFDIKVVDFEILSENVSEDGNSATVEVKTKEKSQKAKASWGGLSRDGMKGPEERRNLERETRILKMLLCNLSPLPQFPTTSLGNCPLLTIGISSIFFQVKS